MSTPTASKKTRRKASRNALDTFRKPLFPRSDSVLLRNLDRVLRGVGQVVFQSNWLTGTVVLAAIFLHSVPYGVAALLGVVASTGAALLLKADRDLLDAGLYGFNGVLVGLGLAAYLSQDFTAGQFLDPLAYGYLVVASMFSTVVMAALATHLGGLGLPALTAPFVLATWVFLFAVTRFGGLEAGPLLAPALPEAAAGASGYTWTTWHEGTFKGVGEIFFQDSWVTGAIVLAGIAINSRISAVMAAAGALLGVSVAILVGAAESDVALGLYGFNAALTAIALGGFFLVLTIRSLLYALFGALVTVVAWAWLATFLAPVGMPTLTMPFVVVTWLFLAARRGLGSLVPVAPPDATFPEDHLRRLRPPLREEGRAAGDTG